MKLFGNSASPFVRKVLLVLHETNRIDAVEQVHAEGNTLNSTAMPVALNPLGKIPVLARPDGPALYDSRVICQYLATQAASDLYPHGQRYWDVLTLEATADGMMDAAVAMVYEARLRADDMQSAGIVTGQWTKVTRAIATLEARWLGSLARPAPDMGHLAIAAALGYLDFRHDDRGWRKQAPGLAAWYESFCQRPSMLATRPQG